MKILKCSSCGADVEVSDGSSLSACPYCGTKYEVKTSFAAPAIINNSYLNPDSLELGYNAQTNNTHESENYNQNYNSNQSEDYNDNFSNYGKKDKMVSLLLCLGLGFFGAHKFYEGKYGMGILYLLTGGLFGIGWFVDFIIILTKPRYY